MAKGLTNGAVPMGAVAVRQEIHDTFMQNTPPGGIELFHGYTYSAHPLACAAALATLQIYEDDQLLHRWTGDNEAYFAQALHRLKDLPGVIDVRNIGLVGAIELAPGTRPPGQTGFSVFLKCFENGVLIRTSGDSVALSPPLIIERSQIDQLLDTMTQAIKTCV
jgi:beta-alanine--pyruvate transaminase